MLNLLSAVGLVLAVVVAFAVSENRQRALQQWRLIVGGVGLQFLLAMLILKTSGGQWFFASVQTSVEHLIGVSDRGAVFLFGDTYKDHFFAFKVLPTIIFVSSLSAVLFHWGIIQRVVVFFARIMQATMRLSGSESLVAAANIFCGQTEAPLVIKPYIKSMTRSEIMAMMSSGMATVAGGVMAAYVEMGISAGHLLAASLMSAPAALVIAKMMVPESSDSRSIDAAKLSAPSEDLNTIAAACRGASEGLNLALNVGAMLIAFIALIALVNLGLTHASEALGYRCDLETAVGFVFAPFAWLMGISWEESQRVGYLLGQRLVLNEFVAYIELGKWVKEGLLSERASTLATYALCGFANLSSIAIQVGGIGALEPSRKREFAELGFKAMIAGTIACYMTACIAGLLIP